MHALVYHVPEIMCAYSCIRQFSGQGKFIIIFAFQSHVEKKSSEEWKIAIINRTQCTDSFSLFVFGTYRNSQGCSENFY